MATIAVVGLGMHGTPGIAAGVFSALAAGGINVVAIAQGSLGAQHLGRRRGRPRPPRRSGGSTPRSSSPGSPAARVIQPERMEIILLGFGQIGRTLATLIGRVRRPALVAPGGRRSSTAAGYVFDPQGLAPAASPRSRRTRRRARGLADAPRGPPRHRRGGDRRTSRATRSRGRCWWTSPPTTPAPRSRPALTHGMDLVLANKRPLAGRRARERVALADRARARPPDPARGHRRRRAADHRHLPQAHRVGRPGGADRGAAVGHAGLRAERGVGRSAVLRARCARRCSAATPSPIRARTSREWTSAARRSSWRGCSAIRASSTARRSSRSFPSGRAPCPSPTFLERLEELDARVEAAGGRGRGRRHGAALRGDGHAAPRSRSACARCPLEPARRRIKGSDNQLVFTTARYKANPLVITGPGAGAEVTAAGRAERHPPPGGRVTRAARHRVRARRASATSAPASTSSGSPWRARATRCAAEWTRREPAS